MSIRHLLIALLSGVCSVSSLSLCAGEEVAKRMVVTTDQPRESARLSAILPDGVFRFSTEDNPARDISKDRLIRWGAAVDSQQGPQILLVDGSLLVADPIGDPPAIVGEALRVELNLFDAGGPTERQVNLPLDGVRGVLFRLPSELHKRDRLLDELVDPERRTDVVVLENGDQLKGAITALDESNVKLMIDAAETEIDIDRVTALAFSSALARRDNEKQERIIVSTADGSRFFAQRLDPGPSASAAYGKIELAGVAAIPVTISKIVGLQPLGKQIDYLSDLKPHSYKHLPLLDVEWPYYEDRSALGNRLRSDGKIYHKGLGMHSTARLTYKLAKPYQRLEADLAIDGATTAGGSVTYRVLLDDGSGKWKSAFTSRIIRGGDLPRPMSIDISKAKRISLVVDFAERGDVQDHANWLDARLVP